MDISKLDLMQKIAYALLAVVLAGGLIFALKGQGSTYITNGPLTYKANDELFSASKSEFAVRNLSWGCDKETEKYFDEILSPYTADDMGTRYDLIHQGRSDDTGIFSVMVIPNKLGHTDLDRFKQDFSVCENPEERPRAISEKYLLFVEGGCVSNTKDYPGAVFGGCNVERFVDPALKLR